MSRRESGDNPEEFLVMCLHDGQVTQLLRAAHSVYKAKDGRVASYIHLDAILGAVSCILSSFSSILL